MPAVPLGLFLPCSGGEVAQTCQPVRSRCLLTELSLDPVTRCRRYAERVGLVGHSNMLLPRLMDYRAASP